MERLKKGMSSLGIPPTRAIRERAMEIEALLKEGKFDAAEAAVDKLITDSRLAELEGAKEDAAAPDFSKQATGDTDVPALQERMEAVKERSQSTVSLPALRDLLKAKAALEEAKANQDPVAVGRILTWAEQRLAQTK
jgi:hypothetical protein